VCNKNFDKNGEYFILPLIVPHVYISYNSAIVGNSINLKKSEHGFKIDLYKNIIRFNYAPTKGYEKICGKRQDIRVCSYIALTGKKPENHPHIENTVYDLNKHLNNNKLIVFYKKNHHKKIINRNRQKFMENGNKIYIILWNRTFFNDILDYCGIKMMDKDPQCGTGLMLLFADLGLCPDVYGIDKKYSTDNYYYYWDTNNKKCEELSKFHNYDDEFSIPKKLDECGVIRLF
jgi:hypothetical protein